MSNNKNKSSRSRQMSSKTPPQIVNFFSKTLHATNNERPASSSSSSPSISPTANDRKRKLSEQESSSQNENRTGYSETLQKDAAKISKIQRTKKVDTLVSTFFQQGNNPDDLSDFESPHKRIHFKTPPVLPKTKVSRKRKLPAKQRKTKNALDTEIFEKVLQHHSNADGLSSDDLQMALALSRSLADANCAGESSSMSGMIRNASPLRKEDIVRQTFEKFGFKKRDNSDYDFRDFFANIGRNKKWTSKFTPLTRRSVKIQKEKFTRKVKFILQLSEAGEIVDGESIQQYAVTSSYLQQFFVSNSPSYNKSSTAMETGVESFYVNDLVPVSTLRCGCLLKNWADIPGRDASPERKNSASSNYDAKDSSSIHNESHSIGSPDKEQDDEIIDDGVDSVDNYLQPNSITEAVEILNEYPEASNIPNHTTESSVRQPLHSRDRTDADRKSDDCHLVDLSDPALDVDINVELTNGREVSPDMFADYESSANNSLNDVSSPIDNTDNLITADSSDNAIDLHSSGSNRLEYECQSVDSENDENCGNDGKIPGRMTHPKDKLPASSPPSAIPYQHKQKGIVVLSSDISSQEKAKVPQNVDVSFDCHLTVQTLIESQLNSTDCSKIAETRQQKSIDSPLINPIVKHLSFTERLQLYHSDPALDDMDDDCMSFTADPLSQDSIVISDDEINYSLYHCRGDERLSVTNRHLSQESIELSDSEDDRNKMSENGTEVRQSFCSLDGNDFACEQNGDANFDSINDEELANLTVGGMYRNGSVIGTVKAPPTIHTQESIEVSDSENETEDRQSFRSLDGDANFESINDGELANLTVGGMYRNGSVIGTVKASPTIHTQESIEISDSEDNKITPPDDDDERQSFATLPDNGNGAASQKSPDINVDDEAYNSNHSLSDEDLINLSIRQMCQKEFVTGSAKSSTTKTFSRTTSDLSFERKTWKPLKMSETFNNHSDDELDEFDKLVRGTRWQSPIPIETSIHAIDDEPDKSRQEKMADDSDISHSNEFIVQSMDQIYEVRTGVLVSPKPDYENMDSPTRAEHLNKYGLKALSKRKAVICLEHIFNRLHPYIELDQHEDLDTIFSQQERHPINSPQKRIDDIISSSETWKPLDDNHFDILQENEDVFYLPSAPRAKKPWCLQPLHIAWHNLIHVNATIYDQILQYKPIDLMDIRSLFKSIDLRYEMNDIMSFLDRKCITFKTDSKRNNAVKKS